MIAVERAIGATIDVMSQVDRLAALIGLECAEEATAGIWRTSLKTQTCEACGRSIGVGERFCWFPWFPGREHSIACRECAEVQR